MSNSGEKIIRNALGIILLIVALNAFGGGYYGMAGAKGVPAEWLEGSLFSNYVIPGIILFVVIGGSALIAAIAVFRKTKYARKAAFVCSVIILIWLAVQISIIGYVSWMQPATTIAAILILFFTWHMPKKFKINSGE
jgi:hypothetical protein